MGRPLPPVFAGAAYHITARGNNGENIFTDDYDRYAYLALLTRAIRLMKIRLFAYSFMTTHVHLVCQTMEANVSATIRRLHGSYAFSFNRRCGRHGHLFEARFGSRLIEDDAYLLEATRYTHLNPVRGGLVDNPEDHVWSSYRCYISPEGQAKQTLVDVSPVLQLFGEDPQARRLAYERFVREGMTGA